MVFIVIAMTAGVVLRVIAALIFHVLKTVTEMATVWMGSATARMAGMERLAMRKLVQIYAVVMDFVQVTTHVCVKMSIQERVVRYASAQITALATKMGFVLILLASVDQTTLVSIVQKKDARKIARNVGSVSMVNVAVT